MNSVRLAVVLGAGLLATGCAGNAVQGSAPEAAPSFAIVQDGKTLAPEPGADGVLVYSIGHGPFSLVVADGAAPAVPVQVCASKDAGIFSGIAVGWSVGQMPCLNGATAMARPLDESPQGVDLMLSQGNGHNYFDEQHSVAGAGGTTVNVRKIADFAVTGQQCFGSRCIDRRQIVPFTGSEAYLVVFADRNRNHVADAGEFVLVDLRLSGALPPPPDAAAEAARFLADNAKKPGVVVTASGLQYEVITQGSGPRPGPHGRAQVQYVAMLTNGTIISSSYDQGHPVDFPLDKIVPGVAEAFQLTPVGGHYRFYVPPALAFGSGGSGKVGPDQVMIYDVRMLQAQ